MKIEGLRWTVLVMVIFSIVIGYVERQSIVVLWPFMAEELFPEKTNRELKEIY